MDVIGTLLALHHLSVHTVSSSPLPMGEGTVWTDHGQLPVPPFAAMRLMVGMKTCPGPGVKSGVVTGELVTPTAAALLRVLTGVADKKKGMGDGDGVVRMGRAPGMTPRMVGIGAGTKDFVKHPNVMRLIVGDEVVNGVEKERILNSPSVSIPLPEYKDVAGEEVTVVSPHEEKVEDASNSKIAKIGKEEHESPTVTGTTTTTSNDNKKWNIDKLTLLQANLDDITAEALSYAVDVLLKKGAVDAWVEPITMKKGRSAHKLNCLYHSKEGEDGKFMETIFRHTTTLGIRIQRDIERASLHRKIVRVQTMYGVGNESSLDGIVNVKLGFMGEEVISVKAEFEDCKAISEMTGVPIKTIADEAVKKAEEQIKMV